MNNTDKLFAELLQIIARLRGPDGCPWDKAQSHQSLAPFAVEETFEMVDAIESRQDDHLKEELGDVLFQVVLHAEIAKERASFNIDDVLETLNDKLVKRHPHVFGNADLPTPEAVKKNWEAMKAKQASPETSPFASIPKSLPALQRSQKIGHRSIRFNFDWSDVRFVMEKVDEELAEVKEAMKNPKDRESLSLEIGDLLFTVTQLARHLDIDAEQALRSTNRKFETRFQLMRELVQEDNKDFSDLQLQDLESYWQKAKKALQ